MYVLALLLPPVAVLLTGRLGSFLVNCLLCACFWLPGMIHAVVVVADARAENRTRRIESQLGGYRHRR